MMQIYAKPEQETDSSASELEISHKMFALTYDDLIMLNGIFQRKGFYQRMLIEEYQSKLSEDAQHVLEIYETIKQIMQKPLRMGPALVGVFTRYETRSPSGRGRYTSGNIPTIVESALKTAQEEMTADVNIKAAFEELKPVDF